jgi:hypothetical protein
MEDWEHDNGAGEQRERPSGRVDKVEPSFQAGASLADARDGGLPYGSTRGRSQVMPLPESGVQFEGLIPMAPRHVRPHPIGAVAARTTGEPTASHRQCGSGCQWPTPCGPKRSKDQEGAVPRRGCSSENARRRGRAQSERLATRSNRIRLPTDTTPRPRQRARTRQSPTTLVVPTGSAHRTSYSLRRRYTPSRSEATHALDESSVIGQA